MYYIHFLIHDSVIGLCSGLFAMRCVALSVTVVLVVGRWNMFLLRFCGSLGGG